jgi:preprotein translocase subunit SecD
MQRSYFSSKNIVLLTLFILSLVYTIPNFFPEQPILQISAGGHQPTLTLSEKQALKQRVQTLLQAQQLSVPILLEQAGLKLVFSTIDTQLKAKDILQSALGTSYNLVINLTSTTPKWLQCLAAQPMKLGLDLSGGIHFTVAIDTAPLLNRHLQTAWYSAMQHLRQAHIRYHAARLEHQKIKLTFPDKLQHDHAHKYLSKQFSDLDIQSLPDQTSPTLVMQFSKQGRIELQNRAIQHTMQILHNRVNELGIAEPIIQQRGEAHISIELPGIQDMAHAQQILGGTATIAFHLVNMKGSGQRHTYQGHPILLNPTPVITGEVITDATTGFSPLGKPAVNITLNATAERHIHQFTRAHLGHLMAIVHKEIQATTDSIKPHNAIPQFKSVERVISVAQINTPLGRHFQITGFAQKEAHDLALLLRAGTLPTPIYIVEKTIIGPQLGHDNIRRGLTTILISFLVVAIFMAFYYKGFGLIANLTLLINFSLLISVLSMLRMTLTLSGMAGILLTLALAVDAQVLIFERIREELRRGTPWRASLTAGYNRAWTTILDANIATLIIACMLFFIGTGAIKGFAITLSIGVFTSMLSSVGYGRALVDYGYGHHRAHSSHSIGI